MKRIILMAMMVSMLVSACNLPGLDQGADEVAQLAEQTVQAQLTSLAEEQAPTETPAPVEEETQEATPEPPTATPEGPTPTAGSEGCTDRAAFVSDVTYPDGADVEAGDSFTKTWRLRNNGSCTWTSSYSLVFDHGDAMNGPASVPLAGAVPPGSTVDLSVNLQAPGSPGTYQGHWLLRNNSGVLFGIGASGNTAFWVKIDVPAPTPTATPTQLIFIPLTPIVIPIFNYSSGQDQALLDGACFDLDAGNSVSCGSGNADFQFKNDTQVSGFPPVIKQLQEYRPQNGTTVRYFGSDSPTKSECSGMSLSNNDIDLDSGDTYCYKTSGGRYGWLHVDSAGLGGLTFDWVTFN